MNFLNFKPNKMEAIKSSNKQVSDRLVVEKLLTDYADFDKTHRESAIEKKAIEQELLELAEKHPNWFSGKTAVFDYGQLKWSAVSKVVMPENFDEKEFGKKYTHLWKIKKELPVSAVRPYLEDPAFKGFGIEIKSEDMFKVVVKG